MVILAITQARIGSTRLPEKVLKTINGVTLLEIHLNRILQSRLISKLKVATTIEPDAEKIVAVAGSLGVEVHKGSVNNVLERFYQAALPEKPDWVVRLTSDCPFIDPVEIDKVIQHALDNDLDYVSNALEQTFPDGLDTEVFKFSALERAFNEAKSNSELEHVTPYIWKNSSFKGGTIFTSGCVRNEMDLSAFRLTVDTLEDFLVVEKLAHILGTDKPWMEYVKALEKYPEIMKLNAQFQRNEGYENSIKKDVQNKNGKRTGTL
jgi:spore coat polysaccharide biosynthesis protein SpsF (cytidylyltransferase family)